GITASYLVLDGFVLELMHYSAPGAAAPYRQRTMNELGLTHLSISVDDVRAVAEKAVELGGQIIEESDLGMALFIRDPDGQLLELLPEAYRSSLPPRPQRPAWVVVHLHYPHGVATPVVCRFRGGVVATVRS